MSITPDRVLILYGSYRSDRMGIRLARYLLGQMLDRGTCAELIDAKEIDLPMLDRMYKEYPSGQAPAALESLADKIRSADAFIFVVGEYNWGVQPGLKNLTDHFLQEWFWRPAAVASYSSGPAGGAHAALAWKAVLSEMGLIVVSTTLQVGAIGEAIDSDAVPIGPAGIMLNNRCSQFAQDLSWWTEAARAQRAKRTPPY